MHACEMQNTITPCAYDGRCCNRHAWGLERHGPMSCQEPEVGVVEANGWYVLRPGALPYSLGPVIQ